MSDSDPKNPLYKQTANSNTETERYLARLCRHSSLRLWSWSNIYRDQKWGNTSIGKEVCDLLIIFENNILIFSDKHCAFPNSGNLEQDWCRWFKRAIWESAKQIWGAERWIKEHPDRLFVNRSCTTPLPIPLPTPEKANYIRIVVAHGSGEPNHSVLGGSGSLMIEPSIVGTHHFNSSLGPIKPFTIGRVSESKGFIHVIDDFSLDILLQTLDTTPDLVRYLERKEVFINSGLLAMAAGEEDLLAYYLQHTDSTNQHDFIFSKKYNHIFLDEGFWEEFQVHPSRITQIQENAVSYSWDRLIDHFTRHILDGTTYSRNYESIGDIEKALRLMARASRTERRMLSKALLGIMKLGAENYRSLRVIKPTTANDPFYVFLTLKPLSDHSYEEYRIARQNLLQTTCEVVRHKFPEARDIVGIATEPLGINNCSEDLIYLDGSYWTDELEANAKELSEQLNILREPKAYHIKELEYPEIDSKERGKGRNRNLRCSCGSGKKYKDCCGK